MKARQSSYDDDESYDLGSDTVAFGTGEQTSEWSGAAKDSVGENNIGFKMLMKFGWKGSGLGKSEQGIIEPVKVVQTDATLGIGKATEYEKNISEVTRDRKKMDVEIDQTADIILKKKEATERQEGIDSDLKTIMQEFYCDSCDKQYKNVAEMSNHLSSYDHHHRKRFKEMKDVAKKRKRGFAIGGSDDARKDDIRRKEERREAKEMENRVNRARAIQEMTAPPPMPPPVPPPDPPSSTSFSSFSSSSSASYSAPISAVQSSIPPPPRPPTAPSSSSRPIPHSSSEVQSDSVTPQNSTYPNSDSAIPSSTIDTNSQGDSNHSSGMPSLDPESVPVPAEEVPAKKFSFSMKSSFMKKK